MPWYGDDYDELGYDDELGDDMDDFGDDEFGASERRIARLLKRRAKLEALLPVVRAGRQKRIGRRLARIDRVLEKSGYSASQAGIADAMSASGIEGVGGLQFQAEAPPGLGRLVRLPFYPTTLNALTDTAAGVGLASALNPICIERLGGANDTAVAHIMQTPQISWATLRIVGFETTQTQQNPAANTGSAMVVSDLQIGGGANLFTHEDFADARIYDADQPEFAGLRDYPILKSPNQAQVTVQAVGNLLGEDVTQSSALLCEVLVDDQYGAHIPGPYARKGAMVRQGGSFV